MNESRPQLVLFWFHVKLAPSPRNCSPCRRRQSSGARCRYRTHRACPTHGTWSVPTEQMHLPRLPRQDVFHPIGHDVLTVRPPTATLQRHPVGPHLLQHMTCLAPGKERPSRVSSSNLEPRHQFSVTSAEFYGTYRQTLHHWFHVKPAHEHGVGITATPTSPCSPRCQERSARCIPCLCPACPIQL